MFGLAAGLYNAYLAPAKLSILLIGLDDAGKTALLERCKVTQFDSRVRGENAPQPTVVRRHASWHGERSPRTRSAAAASKTAGAEGAKDSASPGSAPSMHRSSSAREDPSKPIARRKKLFCPAPASYSREAVLAAELREEEEEFVSSADDDDEGAPLENVPLNTGPADDGPGDDSLTDGPDGGARNAEGAASGASSSDGGVGGGEEEEEAVAIEHDLKRGAKMFPLHMIRPTAGMNLGKLDACGCKCAFWDLGGAERMRALWERYYADADAIVFVVDPTSSPEKIAEAKREFLKVRREDALADVPVLVFFNKMDRIATATTTARKGGARISKAEGDKGEAEGPTSISHGSENRRGVDLVFLEKLFGLLSENETSSNPPNPFADADGGPEGDSATAAAVRAPSSLLAFAGGSAKTGEGVRPAFEWLVSIARKQQRERGRHLR